MCIDYVIEVLNILITTIVTNLLKNYKEILKDTPVPTVTRTYTPEIIPLVYLHIMWNNGYYSRLLRGRSGLDSPK